VSRAEFEAMIRAGELLEWALVHDNHYGVPLSEVRAAFESGLDVFVRVDVQGAASVRKRLPKAVLIFLAPCSLDELKPRLDARGTETESEVQARLEHACREMRALSEFDYVVVNRQDHLDESVTNVRSILMGERARVVPSWVTV
jgi:guanylate kinase